MEDLLTLIIKTIKEKKQISNLEDGLIKKKVSKFLSSNPSIKKKLEKIDIEKIRKSRDFKEVIKRVREEIGIIYGAFLTSDFKKKEKLLERRDIDELLKIHKSTRERKDYYEEVYDKIFSWHKSKKIADICCGMNPLSLINKKVKITCYDLNPNDINFLNNVFKEFNFKGKAKAQDITELEFLQDKDFLDCDTIFFFKALDSLEFIKRNISKEILTKCPQKKIVVSFPRKSLISKKNFNENKRNWFIKFLEKSNFDFKTFEIENETFYLITKNTELLP